MQKRCNENRPAQDLQETSILLVEDCPADVDLLKRTFNRARIANPVFEVTDGQKAIQYLSGQDGYSDRSKFPFPFLVLLDLIIPRLSGFEVLEWIRAQPDLDGLIVVVLTGSESLPDVNKAYELGANSYLVKPTNFDQLVELVKRIESRWLKLRQAPALPVSKGSEHPMPLLTRGA